MTTLRARSVSILVLASCLILAGCASSTKSSSAPKRDRNAPPPGAGPGHWTKVESSLGSNLPRRVWVNDDGTVLPDVGDQVGAGDTVKNVSGDDAKRHAQQYVPRAN